MREHLRALALNAHFWFVVFVAALPVIACVVYDIWWTWSVSDHVFGGKP